MAEPILKWAGGKRQLLDEIYQRFPADYDSYHEPFFGGGAVFFDLEPDTGTINDTNERLMNFYRQVRDSPHELIELLTQFDDPESDPDPSQPFSDTNRKGREIKNYYYQQRERFNNRPYGDEYDQLEEAALLLYLNRTCFNGLFRENSTGGFNVPIGNYSNPDWVRESQIRKASRVLSGIEIKSEDWSYILDVAETDDLVYGDPPYEPMSPTENFTDYSAEDFGKDEQVQLCEKLYQLSSQGTHVVVSNSGVTYGMYDEAGFSVEIEGAKRVINSDAESRDEVDEIIATNVPTAARRTIGQLDFSEF